MDGSHPSIHEEKNSRSPHKLLPHSSYWTMLPSTICSGANGQEPYNHGGAATSVVVGSSNGFMVRIEIGQYGLKWP